MAVLRPLREYAAEAYCAAVDVAIESVLETIADDFCFPAKHVETEIPFVPCREGKSLHSPVKSRTTWKRRYPGRLAGHNGGRNVTYQD